MCWWCRSWLHVFTIFRLDFWNKLCDIFQIHTLLSSRINGTITCNFYVEISSSVVEKNTLNRIFTATNSDCLFSRRVRKMQNITSEITETKIYSNMSLNMLLITFLLCGVVLTVLQWLLCLCIPWLVSESMHVYQDINMYNDSNSTSEIYANLQQMFLS
jgi:hypothetical protein